MITLRIGWLARDQELAAWEIALLNVRVRIGSRFFIGWEASRSC